MGLWEDVFFSSQNVSKLEGHPAAALDERDTEKRIQKKAMRSAKSEMGWNSKSGDSPNSLAGVMQTYIDKTATSLKFSTFVVYLVYVLCLNLTERRKKI